MSTTRLIKNISHDLEITLNEGISETELLHQLSGYINSLIEHDFQKLVVLLYRTDVSETNLRQLLKENPGSDAGLIIARLVIERQVQKIKSRQQFSQRDNDIAENEKW